MAFVRAGNRVVVTFAHRGEALAYSLRRIEPVLLEPGDELPDDPALLFAVASARRGFVLRELGLVLLPDTQVFRKRPLRADARIGRALQSFADLRTGDFVVHGDHGVGKLLGFETKTVAGVTRDYLFLAFRGDDRLYVPHEQIGKVSRRCRRPLAALSEARRQGLADDQVPRPGGSKGAGRRADRPLCPPPARAGDAFQVEGDLIEQLESAFPYEETPDQQRAIEAVKEDLEAPRPWIASSCGDVGFGKTEVAVRAAFAVALNGKQTLFLAPTTILAQQHWNTFRERYRDLPVRVEMVSRWKPADVKPSSATRRGQGRRLIGTHRVLSRDVIPKELGLVVVDEEQRSASPRRSLGSSASRWTCWR